MLCGVMGSMPQSAAWAGGWELALLYAPPALPCAQTGQMETGSHLIARRAMCASQHNLRGFTSLWPLPFRFAEVHTHDQRQSLPGTADNTPHNSNLQQESLMLLS